MAKADSIAVYLEVGTKRVFAGALDWPGWSRGARDEEGALQALFEYAQRYRAALAPKRLGFAPPRTVEDLLVTERVRGDATTDFGAPSRWPKSDDRDVDPAELKRLLAILRASWAAFDAAAQAAAGKELRRGPRGGGRDVPKMVAHVLDAESSYLRRVGRVAPKDGGDAAARMAEVRDEMVAGITALARGEPPEHPLRSGNLWPARYAVRRSAWHALDHAWEIEDRVV